jgi:hypothetical protein
MRLLSWHGFLIDFITIMFKSICGILILTNNISSFESLNFLKCFLSLRKIGFINIFLKLINYEQSVLMLNNLKLISIISVM